MLKVSAAAIKRLKLLAPLLAAPAALLLNPGRAEAILTYNIFQSGSDVVVSTSGSLDTASAASVGSNDFTGVNDNLNRAQARIWTGGGVLSSVFNISGPTSLLGAGGSFGTSPLGTGIWTALSGGASQFAIASSYASGSSIVSTATFANRTLASFGLTTPGVVGTWSLLNGEQTVDSIQAIVGAPAAVPGPLPLLGAAAAFGWSRRLRRRISDTSSTAIS